MGGQGHKEISTARTTASQEAKGGALPSSKTVLQQLSSFTEGQVENSLWNLKACKAK